MGQAVILMFVAMSMIPAGDLAGKLLTGGHGVAPAFVGWSRFILGTMMILPFLRRIPWALLRDWRIWLRAMFLAGGILSIQTALRTAPMADVFAAFFIGPMFSFALSALLLREPVGPLRIALMGLGFAGVLLVARPGFGGAPGIGWALLAGLFYGAFLTASRWLAHLGTARGLSFTQLLLGAVLLAPIGLPQTPPLTAPVITLTVASAAFSMLGNMLLIVAYTRAPASRMAPLVYFQLIAATGLGWAAFGDLPDTLTWAGLALVIGAGLSSAMLRR